MKFLTDYSFILVVLIAISFAIGYEIYIFKSKTQNEQLAKVKEWLLWAVAEAEKELGGGTGQLKLRFVYGLFIERFNQLSKVISFEMFSSLVDEALDRFREMLETNKQVSIYVKGE